MIVEADETVLSRRQIILNPTSVDDEILDSIWILGLIDNSPQKKFVVKKVANRQIETLTLALENKIGVCSFFCTDGYPSYPGVARNLGLEHRVVNHNVGFFDSRWNSYKQH